MNISMLILLLYPKGSAVATLLKELLMLVSPYDKDLVLLVWLLCPQGHAAITRHNIIIYMYGVLKSMYTERNATICWLSTEVLCSR